MNKQFDVGIYSFKRQIAGFICPEDDQKCKDGQIFGVLHPLIYFPLYEKSKTYFLNEIQ